MPGLRLAFLDGRELLVLRVNAIKTFQLTGRACNEFHCNHGSCLDLAKACAMLGVHVSRRCHAMRSRVRTWY